MSSLFFQADDTLVSSYIGGCNEAFDVLLNRYRERVYIYIQGRVKNHDTTEDILQETFIKVLTTVKQNGYTSNGKFLAWVLRIAHNLVIDHFRQQRGKCFLSSDDENTDILNNSELCDHNIEEVMIASQIETDVHKLINTLPESQREVIMMRFFQDLSFKEIAQQTEVSTNTALGRMRYALLNIRRLVRENHIALAQ